MFSLSNAYRSTRNLACISALIVVIVYMTPRYLNNAAAMGWQFQQPDMATDYVKGVYWSILVGLTIFLWPVPLVRRKMVLTAWLAKMGVTLGAMLFYESRYGGDAGAYLAASRTADFSFAEMRINGGTENLINFARLHRMLFPDSFHAMKVSFAMLGLIGIYFFYRAGVIFVQREDRRIFYLLAFFPGILFWSSILGKDPLVFFGISLYCYGVIGFHVRRQLRFLPALFLGVLAATMIRQWLAIIMMIPFGLLLFVGFKSAASRFLCCFVVAILLYLSAAPMLDRFKIEAASDILSVADTTTKGFVNTAGGSTQQLDVDLTTTRGILTFLPFAAFNAIFRPLPGDVLNPFGMLASLESALLLWLLFLSLKRSRWKDFKEPLVLWAVSFLVIWALINGIVSSTNFGVAVRYKLQVLPLLLGVLLYLSRRRTQPEVEPLPLPVAGAAAAAEVE